MDFETTIKAKHSFQDSMQELLSYISAMSYRELELAAARIADDISSDEPQLNPQSAIICGKTIRIVLALRDNEQLAESKLKRLWMGRKKGEIRKTIAEREYRPQFEAYQNEVERVERIREKEQRQHTRELQDWRARISRQPLFKRLIEHPGRPPAHSLTPMPKAPPPFSAFVEEVGSKMNLGDMLVDLVVNYRFPHIEAGDSFVNEETVRSMSLTFSERG